MKSVRSSFGLFILIFSVYWISDLVTYYFFKNTDNLVVKFIIITIVAFVIIAINNLDNKRIEKKMLEILEKSNKQLLNTSNKILSSQSMPIEKRLQEVCLIIKEEFDLENVFISIKKDNYLDIINYNSSMDNLMNDSKISLKLNKNNIKILIANEFNTKEHLYEFKTIKKEVNGIYVHEVLNIPILSKFSSTNFGVITLLVPENITNKGEILSQLLVLAENIGLNLFIDRQNSNKIPINSITKLSEVENKEISFIKYKYANKDDMITICIDLENIKNFKKNSDNDGVIQIQKSIISLTRNIIRDVEVNTLFNKKSRLFIIFQKDELENGSILINRLLEKLKDLKLQEVDMNFGINKLERLKDIERIEIIKILDKVVNN